MTSSYAKKDRLVIETQGNYQVCSLENIEFPVEPFISEENTLILKELCNQIAMLKTVIFKYVVNHPDVTTHEIIDALSQYQSLYTRINFNHFKSACRHAVREIQTFGFTKFKYTSAIPAVYIFEKYISSSPSTIKIQIYGHEIIVRRQPLTSQKVKDILDNPLFGNFILNDQTLMLSITGQDIIKGQNKEINNIEN